MKSAVHSGIARSTLWNLAGSSLPVLAGVYAIPRLFSAMGETRFGLLALVWALIGYFSLFDLGIGRAITHSVSRMLGYNKPEAIPSLFWTGCLALTAVAFAGGLLFAWLAPQTLPSFVALTPQLQGEAHRALHGIALSIPLVALASATRGLLESFGQFPVLNLIRIPHGVMTFMLPLCFPGTLNDLGAVTLQLVALRGLLVGLLFLAASLKVPEALLPLRFSTRDLRELLRFGGWMTVSNVVSPILTTADRFFIGTMLSPAAVSYYTTPYEIIARFSIVPASLSGALFPVLGRGIVEDPEAVARVYAKARWVLAAVMLGGCLLVAVAGQDLLALWMGKSFANRASGVLTLLTLGIFINGVSYPPFTLLQSSGQPKQTALCHVAELFVYAPLLYGLVSWLGILGAAAAWSLRVLMDYALLEILAQRVLPQRARGLYWSSVLCGLLLLAGLPAVPGLWIRAAILVTLAGAALHIAFRRHPHLFQAGSTNQGHHP